MKLTVFILFLSFMQLSASVYSQATKFTFKYENKEIADVLRKIEDNSKFRFFYLREQVDVERLVSISAKDATVEQILDELFKDKGISYELMNDFLIVLSKEGTRPEINMLKNSVFAQQGAVSGKVTDESGQPLPGVSIVIKGTTQGTVTGTDGSYTLINLPADAVLVFSFVGMRSQEMVVGNQTNINVRMEAETIGLEEVVAVGYGTQKKVNLTGSVSYIRNDELEKRNVTKSSLALQGQLSGISVRQLSGNPTKNNASLLVRGRGTFSSAGTTPLVIVDGIESSIDNINYTDIESISILKDAASAAIYGSKAANGVILIETKKGTIGEPVVTINSYVGKQIPTMVPKMVESWEYCEIVNESRQNIGSAPRYTPEEISKYKSGVDPNYPNFDHVDYMWRSGSGFETKNDIGIRGGTETSRYLLSLGYYNQDGIVMRNAADRYDVRLNLNSKLKDNLEVNVNLVGNTYEGQEPTARNGNGLSSLTISALRMANILPGPTEDGFFSHNETHHSEADLHSKSFQQYESSYFYGNTSLVWDISKDFKITGQAGYSYNNSSTKTYVASYQVTPVYGYNSNFLSDSWNKGYALTLQSIFEYQKLFGNHQFHILGGISGQEYYSKNIYGYRDEFPNNELYELNVGSAAHQTNSGTASKYKLQSYFGRFNYNFLEKYLFELNFRYDGSSRFPIESRWGLFPSFSGAWRLSEENFLKDRVPWLDNLKLRASWGELGNQSIGNYPYQSLVNLGENYPVGNSINAGAAVTTIANKNITWETTTISNVGLDVTLFDNHFSFSLDYFIKETKDILYSVSVSPMLGASPSATNAGSVENNGWDFEINYKNMIRDFSYGINANFSVIHNKVTRLAHLDQDIGRGLFIGHPIGSSYGYVSDGLFVNDEELENYAIQPFSFIANAGGIKFVDINGPDGVPDGKVTSQYDRTIIGQPLPITTYGLTLFGGYKNFDFNILLQGEGGRKEQVRMSFFHPLDNNGNVQKYVYDNRWTNENPDPNAKYPKILVIPTDFYLQNPVDYFFLDATFLRVKNIQIGYNLPKRFLNRLFFDKVRLYASGENLLTLTNYYDQWDPEMSASGSYYPVTKLYSIGINLTF